MTGNNSQRCSILIYKLVLNHICFRLSGVGTTLAHNSRTGCIAINMKMKDICISRLRRRVDKENSAGKRVRRIQINS